MTAFLARTMCPSLPSMAYALKQALPPHVTAKVLALTSGNEGVSADVSMTHAYPYPNDKCVGMPPR